MRVVLVDAGPGSVPEEAGNRSGTDAAKPVGPLSRKSYDSTDGSFIT